MNHFCVGSYFMAVQSGTSMMQSMNNVEKWGMTTIPKTFSNGQTNPRKRKTVTRNGKRMQSSSEPLSEPSLCGDSCPAPIIVKAFIHNQRNHRTSCNLFVARLCLHTLWTLHLGTPSLPLSGLKPMICCT